jgi:thiamine-monophosphate kinase
MIDLSDGLGADAGHLAAASGAAAWRELERVPGAPAVAGEASWLDTPAARFAAGGGEDYELLVALPAGFSDQDVRALESVCGLPLTRVGEMRDGGGVHARLGGRPVTLAGFDHFAPRSR